MNRKTKPTDTHSSASGDNAEVDENLVYVVKLYLSGCVMRLRLFGSVLSELIRHFKGKDGGVVTVNAEKKSVLIDVKTISGVEYSLFVSKSASKAKGIPILAVQQVTNQSYATLYRRIEKLKERGELDVLSNGRLAATEKNFDALELSAEERRKLLGGLINK